MNKASGENAMKVLTVSCGIALGVCPIHDFHELIEHADTAVYYAKKAGKNRTVIYKEGNGGERPSELSYQPGVYSDYAPTIYALTAAIDAGVKKVVCLSTDKAAYPINAMGISKAMMEKVIGAKARTVKAEDTTICCTRYGNVMCSRGSVIPLFIDQIKAGKPITITDPDMTRFLMNLDEAVDLVQFAFEHANPGDLFVQKSDASTIGDLAKAVQKLFGDTGTQIIGTRHGEKLYETLMTKEERIRSEDMGGYYRVSADGRDLNYDKFVVKGQVHTEADEAYTSHNTRRLNVDETVEKILTTDYVREALEGWNK